MAPKKDAPTPFTKILDRLHALEQRVENIHTDNHGAIYLRMKDLEEHCRGHVNSTLLSLSVRGDAVNHSFEKMEAKTQNMEDKMKELANHVQSMVSAVEKKLDTWNQQADAMDSKFSGLLKQAQRLVSVAEQKLHTEKEHMTDLTQKMTALEGEMMRNKMSMQEQAETTESMLARFQDKAKVPVTDPELANTVTPAEWDRRQASLISRSFVDDPFTSVRRARSLAGSREQSRERLSGGI